ncbi:hypothetical protein EV126DRAFT_422045 [Verticillium dahliae]|nr:hypothetical protein EV126DRAFT_422045 [Verticillium dahliae]
MLAGRLVHGMPRRRQDQGGLVARTTMAGADVDVPLTCSSRGEILGIQSQRRSRCARRGIPQRQTQPDGCSSRGSVFSYSPQHSPFNWLNHRPTRRPQEIKIQQSKSSSSTWSMMRAVVRSAPGYVKKVDRCKISAVGPGTPKPLVCVGTSSGVGICRTWPSTKVRRC